MNVAVVMPVYNEQEAIEKVVREWIDELNSAPCDYSLIVINDGSKDDTLNILNRMAMSIPTLKVISKPNSGHGQTCVYGYRVALQSGYDWIFQIDSDGQCDPRYFKYFLHASQDHNVLYGYRRTRDDGVKRFIISRIVSVFVYLATGTWVRDANVPYRLMHKDTLTDILDRIPNNFHLANILVSILQKQRYGITWIDIHFRKRAGGTKSVKRISFLKNGFQLYRQLQTITKPH
jgi:glycosyltransferase involved in cell wall biosynthesis